jgi:hypothetical protein
MTEAQLYNLWAKFVNSKLMGSLPDGVEAYCEEHKITVGYNSLPDDVEAFCEEHEITVDYFIEEFM